MSRSGTIRIPREVLARIAELPPGISGRVLAWGWRCYLGETIFIDEELEKDATTRHVLAIASDLLDPTALALNIIDITAFSEERINEEERVAKRQAAKDRKAEREAQEAESNIVPIRRYANGIPEMSQGTKGDHQTALDPRAAAAVMNLVDHGIDQREARQIVEHFSKNFDAGDILTVTQNMAARSVGNPESYFKSSLENLAKRNRKMAAGNPLRHPRAVRRQIPARKDGLWEFLGWTCENHPRAGKGISGRFKIWRTDSGRLSYKLPDENEMPPTFDQDPGLMETE